MYFKSKYSRDELFSTPELRRRGWTPAMIRDLLGDHDDTRPNPRYSSAGAPMQLWLKERVEAAEATDAFHDRVAKAQRRSESSKKAAETKREELKRLVQTIKITVIRESLDDLTHAAIESYNLRGIYREALQRRGEWFLRATEDSDPDFLDRITVNYIRHELTSYDELMHSLVGLVGRREAQMLLRGRLMDAIAATYPEFAIECARQTNEWEERQDEAEMSTIGDLF